MQRVGIIDLGSNTVRLVVYDVDKGIFGRKRVKGSNFRTVLNEKCVAGLSAYVVNGMFTDEGIERAIDVLNEHIESARNVNCKFVHIFATAVIRNCSNNKQVVSAIENAIKHKIDLLTGEQEAHLGFVGATIGTKLTDGLLVDIGGGSTELTTVCDGLDSSDVSIPLGSVSSYANFVSLILPQPAECIAIQEAIASFIKDIPSFEYGETGAMYGIGGSIRAVAKICGRLDGDTKAKKVLTQSDVERVLDLLNIDPSTLAHIAVKAAPERLHSVIPGCIILREIMNEASGVSLTVCKYGVREGYLVERVIGA